MALNASLNKFRSELSETAARNIQHSRPTSSAPTRTGTPKPGGDSKRSHDAAFPASQPNLSTPAGRAEAQSRQTGSEMLTQVYTAVKYLKEKSPQVLAFDDIISYLSLPLDQQKNIPLIRRALRESDRASYLSKTDSGTGKESFTYRPLYPITNAEELKDYLATLSQETAQGIPVKDLKDGWPDCNPALDRLETEGFLLITRWKKDDTPRTIYPDSPSYHILNPTSQLPQKVDPDFRDFWGRTKLPGSEVEIRNELEKAGLTPTSQVREVRKMEAKRKEKRRVNRKGGKTTNAHMLGILKDYSRK